jgi:hypothetical protein
VELYIHFPNKPSWRDAQLKQRDNLTFTVVILFGNSVFQEFTIHVRKWEDHSQRMDEDRWLRTAEERSNAKNI